MTDRNQVDRVDRGLDRIRAIVWVSSRREKTSRFDVGFMAVNAFVLLL